VAIVGRRRRLVTVATVAPPPSHCDARHRMPVKLFGICERLSGPFDERS